LQSLEDVTGIEFRMFMDFLKSLSLFGEKAPAERMKELIGIIEGQADLDAQFNVIIIFFSFLIQHTNTVILYVKRICFELVKWSLNFRLCCWQKLLSNGSSIDFVLGSHVMVFKWKFVGIRCRSY